MEHVAAMIAAIAAFLTAWAALRSSRRNEQHLMDIKIAVNGRIDALVASSAAAATAAAAAASAAVTKIERRIDDVQGKGAENDG